MYRICPSVGVLNCVKCVLKWCPDSLPTDDEGDGVYEPPPPPLPRNDRRKADSLSPAPERTLILSPLPPSISLSFLSPFFPPPLPLLLDFPPLRPSISSICPCCVPYLPLPLSMSLSLYLLSHICSPLSPLLYAICNFTSLSLSPTAPPRGESLDPENYVCSILSYTLQYCPYNPLTTH